MMNAYIQTFLVFLVIFIYLAVFVFFPFAGLLIWLFTIFGVLFLVTPKR